MQVASRESFGAATAQLDEVADEVGPGDLAQLADELLAVARLLHREPVLRRSLSDPAAAPRIRRNLLDAVVGGQLSDRTMQLLHQVVAARWSSAGDLFDAVELLGVQALLASAQADNALADVEDELFRFLRVVSGDPELGLSLADPTADTSRRNRLVDDLLDGKAHRVTVSLVKVAVAGLGGRGFVPSLERLVELAAQRRDREVAYVTVATPLTDEQERRLEAALSRTYRRQMSLLVVVDPALIGGMTVRVADQLYDGSITRRLAQVRTALAG